MVPLSGCCVTHRVVISRCLYVVVDKSGEQRVVASASFGNWYTLSGSRDVGVDVNGTTLFTRVLERFLHNGKPFVDSVLSDILKKKKLLAPLIVCSCVHSFSSPVAQETAGTPGATHLVNHSFSSLLIVCWTTFL